MSKLAGKRFRVAFSFAGEKRDFVAHVAGLLAREFGTAAILYDKYHEAEFAHWKLGLELPDLYRDESALIVVVICTDYSEKDWCGLEWLAIHGLMARGEHTRVMLCRFGHAKLQGVHENGGFVELDHKTADDAARLILERLALNERLPKDHYTKPVPTSPTPLTTSIPHNLPSLQPFFGREEELKKIAEALDPESRGWGALIDGPGGMGKTSLAVRAAYDVSPEVFRKIIFVLLKTRELDDDGVRDLSGFLISGLAELFGELARELGHADIVKAAEEQRPRLLLEALRGTQTLLILDNLESLTKAERDTVFTFVKRLPGGCKAILTSRGRVGSGAEELILEKLSEAAALATLAELATHNPLLAQTSEAERLVLYRETGGKPLLLRWTAGQLGRGSCRRFPDALRFLRSCPPGNDPLEFIFGDLVVEFTEGETRVLCALAYFTLPAKVEHLTQITELEELLIRTALASLANRSLIVPDLEEKAFTIVPMVDVFLRRVRPEVVEKVGQRMVKHVVDLLIANGSQQHSRFPLLENAWPLVSASLPRFFDAPNNLLQGVCGLITLFLEFSGRWDESIGLDSKAEVIAAAAFDQQEAGWRAYRAGWIYSLREQAEAVIDCANRAIGYWKDLELTRNEIVAALLLRGHGYRLLKKFEKARQVYRDAVEAAREDTESSPNLAICLNWVGVAEMEIGDLAAGEQSTLEALQASRESGYEEGTATYTGNLAVIALKRHEWSAAETYSRNALILAEGVGRLELIGGGNFWLAEALLQQGRAAEALPYARRAIEIFSQLGSPQLELALETLLECETGKLPEDSKK